MKKKASTDGQQCSSAACTRRGTHLAVGDTGDGLPEPFCVEHLRVLTDDSVELRPGGFRALLWRVWDETRAHHHVATCFLLSGLVLQTGLDGWKAWMVLTLLATAAVVDVVAMHRWSYRLWVLSIVPLVLSVAVVAMVGASVISTVAVFAALLHACLLANAWHDRFADQYDPGPDRPGSSAR